MYRIYFEYEDNYFFGYDNYKDLLSIKIYLILIKSHFDILHYYYNFDKCLNY